MKSFDKLAKLLWDKVLAFRDWATFVDPKIAKERYRICVEDCRDLIRPTMQCKHCMCFMVVKTKLRGTYCPKGKWHKSK